MEFASCFRRKAIQFRLVAPVSRRCNLDDTQAKIVSVTLRNACAKKSAARPRAHRLRAHCLRVHGLIFGLTSPLAAEELQLEAQDIEIILGLLTPRATGAPSVKGSRSAGAVDVARVMSLVRTARDEFERRRAAGDAVGAAILTLAAEEWGDAGTAKIEAAASGQGGSGSAEKLPEADTDTNTAADRIAVFVHDFAVETFKAGHIGRAVVLFATLLQLAAQEAEALSGLALCGVRLGRFEEALTLAMQCLTLPVKHPRAYCIAGFCELERGNRKAAQSLLALGARIARKRPEFAEDLRAAQRVLLILHFA